ncbi:MAG: CBS domain-containing protein [Firmicutes bacterium]|nr:CBS domain-containing protein [Bacillota bacterium]
MQVGDLLREKGQEVITVPATATAYEAMGKLVEHRIGSVVVVDETGFPVGIITERDFLRLSYEHGEKLRGMKVAEIMTRDLLVGIPTDTLEYAMSIMTTNRLRHLPIVSGRELVGIISIGDVVKALLKETEATNRYLKDYISGSYPA